MLTKEEVQAIYNQGLESVWTLVHTMQQRIAALEAPTPPPPPPRPVSNRPEEREMVDWALAKRAEGVLVLPAQNDREAVVVLEFNEFLIRIARETIQADDSVVSPIFTEGRRRRVGDLRLYGMVRSGQVRTENMPLRYPDGLIAAGSAALALLPQYETDTSPDLTSPGATLLRPASDSKPRQDDLLLPAPPTPEG
jgi:hypothetical protein